MIAVLRFISLKFIFVKTKWGLLRQKAGVKVALQIASGCTISLSLNLYGVHGNMHVLFLVWMFLYLRGNVCLCPIAAQLSQRNLQFTCTLEQSQCKEC